MADVMELRINCMGPLRAGLIGKGMIYSPAYCETVFTVPLFDDSMRRSIPEFSSKGDRP